MIDQATIDRIVEAAEITDVISEFVTLKRRGVNMIGLCPFHNEKTPSFIVSPAKGIFKCFGCGKGGNAVNFIMEHESLTYPEALKWLARKYQIEVKEEEVSPEQQQIRDQRESMMIVSAYAQKYFSRYLLKEEEGRTIGLSYLKERGIREQTIHKFDLGFCPDGKDVFTQAAIKQGYKLEYLEQTGLTIKRENWIRDRFSGRVMFPIHSISGRVIAFGGRTLKQDKKAAKYLNSPESDIYHKSKVLYGIYQAKREITRLDRCYLVEGYTDVLSFHQAGIINVVASSGTSLTSGQIRLIKRFTNNITIIYDGDAAGIKASLRGIDLVLEEGINVKVLLLPDGEDPDSFARSMGSTELQQYITDHETDFIRFKTQLLLQNTENDPIGRARLIADIVQSIAVVPEAITRSVYIQECSRLLDVHEEILYEEVRKIKMKETEKLSRQNRYPQTTPAKTLQTNHIPTENSPVLNSCEVEEREIIRILLRFFNENLFEEESDNPEEQNFITVGQFVIEELENDGLKSDNQLINRMLDYFSKNVDNPDFDAAHYFTFHNDPMISQLTSDLLADKYTESKRWKKGGAFVESEKDILDVLVPKIVQEYKMSKVRNLLKELEIKIQQATSENDIDKIMDCQNQYINLKKVEKILSVQLGNRAII